VYGRAPWTGITKVLVIAGDTMSRFILGVTGNIATGKSTVVEMLVEKGAHHIDADEVYHELIRPGQPLLEDLVAGFGERILNRDGSLDRKALGSIVFYDPSALAKLDAITHPAVIAESDRRAFAIEDGVVILDAVKLVESGHAEICDAVWLVTAPQDTQVERLMRRNRLDDNEAWARVEAQPPPGPKLARADVVISNIGSLTDLRREVNAAWDRLPIHDDSQPT
jgi:dephospho-CoA kinase